MNFFIKTFSAANITVQFTQAIICVVFINIVSQIFSDIGVWFYTLGGFYILYLSYKVISNKQSNTEFKLDFSNLAIVMLLSPKIWLLFPSGAIIANQLEQGLIVKSIVFGSLLLIVSSFFFWVYVIIGKLGSKVLKDNFSYLSSFLLILFAVFLFNEAINLI